MYNVKKIVFLFLVLNFILIQNNSFTEVLNETKIKKEVKKESDSKSSKSKNENDIQKRKKDIVEKYRLKDFRGVIAEYESDPYLLNEDEVIKVLVGVSYREDNQDKKAIEILNFLSKNNKINEKIALEKAISYFKLKDVEQFQKEADKIEQSTSDQQILNFINTLRNNLIKKKDGKIFYGSVGAGFLYDTNPLMSSVRSNINLYGIEYLNQGASADIGLMSNALLGYNYKLDNGLVLFGSSNISYIGYKTQNIRDTFSTNLLQGIAYRFGKFTLSLPVSYNNLAIGSSNIGNPANLFLQFYTIAPSFEYKTDNNITFKSTFRFNQKFFGKQMAQRDSFVYMFDQAVYTNITNYTVVYASAGVGYEDATKDKIWTNNFYSFSVMARQYVPIKSVLTYFEISYGLSVLNYQGYASLWNAKRLDFYNSLKTSIHAILFDRLDLYVSYIFERNVSNANIYDFARHRIMTGFSLMF